jgi:hypothetical protein
MIRFALSLAAATLISSGGWTAFGNALDGRAASPPVIAHVYSRPHRLRTIGHVFARRRVRVSDGAVSKNDACACSPLSADYR